MRNNDIGTWDLGSSNLSIGLGLANGPHGLKIQGNRGSA